MSITNSVVQADIIMVFIIGILSKVKRHKWTRYSHNDFPRQHTRASSRLICRQPFYIAPSARRPGRVGAKSWVQPRKASTDGRSSGSPPSPTDNARVIHRGPMPSKASFIKAQRVTLPPTPCHISPEYPVVRSTPGTSSQRWVSLNATARVISRRITPVFARHSSFRR